MDAPPAIAKLYNGNNNDTSHNKNTNNNFVNQNQYFQQQQQHQYESNVVPYRVSSHEAVNSTLHDVMSNSLHPLVDQLRQEIKELKAKLAHSVEEKNYAVGQAKADTYVHVVRVLKQEGVPGVERLKTQYGGDAVAATLRAGGGMMFVGGGGGVEMGDLNRKNVVHVAAPSVNGDSLTREELHSGLRKALRNL